MARMLLIDIPLPKANKFGAFMARFGSRFPPLNIISLGTVLTEQGHEVRFVFEDEGYQTIADRLTSFKPDLVGVTCMTMSYNYLDQVIRIVRDYDQDIPIVVGGFHPSVFPETVLEEHHEIAAVFVGESDRVLPYFLNMIDQRGYSPELLTEIPNLAYHDSLGRVTKNERAPLMDNLDELPFPDFDLVDNYFQRFYPAFNRHFLPLPNVALNTSRGCPFKCYFCGRQITGSRIRSFSVDYRIELIKYLKKRHKIRSIIYTDELLTASKKTTLEFCDRIQSEGLQDIAWVCSGRVDTIDDQIAPALVAAGCKQVGFGLESGSPEILKNINKLTSVDRARQALDCCRQHGLGSFATFMLGCFGETEETLKETYSFIMSNPIDYIILCNFTPMPGSKSWEMWPEYGRLLTDDYRQFNTFSGLVFLPFGLTEDDLRRWRKKIYRGFYFRPGRMLREARYAGRSASWHYIYRVVTGTGE